MSQDETEFWVVLVLAACGLAWLCMLPHGM
jgi:hypothetical protein